MSLRLPLSAKILLWFFLNLAALAAVFILLFNAQFRFDLDWVFASSARQRVDAVRDLIVGELNTTPPDDWDGVIERFGDAYRVHFALFENNGAHLIGQVPQLPLEVQARMKNAPQKPVPSPSAGTNLPGVPLSPDRAFLRTTNPTRYWLLLHARLNNPQAGNPMRVFLVAQADSLSVGGLILDPAPWFALAVGAIVFSVLFWLPLLRGITRSIAQMTFTTREIAAGRFDVRVALRRTDELGLLSEVINQMAARLDGLVKGQKRFLGDIAHELCSPLARLRMILGIIEQRGGEGCEDYTKSASEKAGQIAALVDELLLFSRASFGDSTMRLSPVKVHEAVEEAIQWEEADSFQIERAIGPDLEVQADAELLVRALANLIRNAIRHAGDSGQITIGAVKEGDRVTIRVADNGPGVPEADLVKIFDAFYRVDTSRTRSTGGTGLGLTIVKTCIESCGGSVRARIREPHGLEVLITLHFPKV